MKRSGLIPAALAALFFAASAGAHTHLSDSTPAEGSVLTSSPDAIVLNFSGPARLTALSIQKEAGTEQKIEPLPTEAAKQISIPSPKLTPGAYVLTWRVLGHDNHVMSGKVHFTLSGEASAKQ